jgi:hypothetical protein
MPCLGPQRIQYYTQVNLQKENGSLLPTVLFLFRVIRVTRKIRGILSYKYLPV